MIGGEPGATQPYNTAELFDSDQFDQPYEDNRVYLEDVAKYVRACLLGYGMCQRADCEEDDLQEIENAAAGFRRHIESRTDAGRLAGISLPLANLLEIFRLSPVEVFLVMLAFALEMDDCTQRIVAGIVPPPGVLAGSIGFGLHIHYRGEPIPLVQMERLRVDSALFLYFLTPSREDESHPIHLPLRLDGRMLDYIVAQEGGRRSMRHFVRCIHPDDPLPELLADTDICDRMASYAIDARAERPTTGKSKILYFLYGQEGCGKKLKVKRFCAAKGNPVLLVDLTEVLAVQETPGWQLTARLCRETVLKRAALCFYNFQVVLEQERLPAFLQILDGAARYVREVFLLSETAWKPRHSLINFSFIPIAIKPLSPLLRLEIWERLAANRDMEDIRLSDIANKFSFTVGQIESALESAATTALWNRHSRISEDDLYAGCYHQIDHKLEGKAQRIYPKYNWEDLILAEAQKTIIRMACDQIRYRHKVYNQWGFEAKITYGTGVILLFNGPPGTGKTMAAEVMANDLKLELYKVDLSAVVSKYIGETEKNIRELFEQAHRSDAILFFDEADALFAKRTEVKDAQDKNSNMETAYLLQKMEEYSGVIVLATNYYQNFDAAFKRRIKLVVNFEMPRADSRRAIWQSVFPKQAPQTHVDFDFLASRFELSGSSIKNIVLNAAFVAAAAGDSIDMNAIIQALQHEYIKLGINLQKEKLDEYSVYLK